MWFSVKLNGKKIDSVCFSGSVEEVRKSLIDHDGYDSQIVVKKERSNKPRSKKV